MSLQKAGCLITLIVIYKHIFPLNIHYSNAFLFYFVLLCHSYTKVLLLLLLLDFVVCLFLWQINIVPLNTHYFNAYLFYVILLCHSYTRIIIIIIIVCLFVFMTIKHFTPKYSLFQCIFILCYFIVPLIHTYYYYFYYCLFVCFYDN